MPLKQKEIGFIKGFISIISIQSKTWAQRGACRSKYIPNNNICRKVNMLCFLEVREHAVFPGFLQELMLLCQTEQSDIYKYSLYVSMGLYIWGKSKIRKSMSMICVLVMCNANAQLQESGLSRIVLKARNSFILLSCVLHHLKEVWRGNTKEPKCCNFFCSSLCMLSAKPLAKQCDGLHITGTSQVWWRGHSNVRLF